MVMERIRVIIVEDHFLMRLWLRKTLTSKEFGMEVEIVGEAADAAQFYALLRDGVVADLVILDIRLPDESGIDIARHLKNEKSELKILIHSAENSNELIKQIITLKVGGFVSKGTNPKELRRAMESVLDGVKYFGKDIAKLMHNVKIAKSEVCETVFTNRELDILRLAAQGLYSKEIGEKLGMNPKTVNVHKSNIFKKLGINNSVELAHYALNMGFIKG